MEQIDILMATYNGEKYIKEQLDSIINQTYKNIRIIISDDASTDNTSKILREYEKKDNRIIVYLQEKNIGSNANFEFLMKKVESKYYMFSDQDDVWFDNKVEKTYFKILSTGASLVCTDLLLVDENLNSLNDTFNHKMKKLYKLKKYDDWKMVFLYNVVTGCTIMAKKQYINKILPLPINKNILHDHFIPLVISNYEKIAYLDEPTMYYRQHSSNQVGTKKYTDKFNDFNEVRNYLIDLKISIFTTYIERKKCFNEEFNLLAKEGLEYFKYIKDCKNINFKKLNIFMKIYKYDTTFFIFWNFILFNIPILAKIGYKFKKLVKRMCNK